MKRLSLLLCSSTALACAHHNPAPTASQPADSPLRAEVDAARAEARKLLVVQSELAWRSWVFGDPLDLAKTYVGHEALFTAQKVSRVAALDAQTTDAVEHRALEAFRVYLAGEALGRETAPIVERIAALQAGTTFQGADGAEHPFRELERLAAGERDHRARVALGRAALPVLEKLNPLLQEKDALVQKLLPQLGYPTALAFASALRSVDLGALGKQAQSLLEATDGFYPVAMDRELRLELGLSLAEARRADISRFNRSADLDGAFASDKMLPRLRETLAGLGFHLEQQTNIRIDDAPLTNKNPRSVCFDVQVPSDIRVSVKPIGGVSDYRALFHEMGHAEQYANTKTPVFEFQQLGDDAPAEAYAFLFEGLIDNPLWLADHLGPNAQKLQDFVRAAAVKRLFLVRRYAGKLLYDLSWPAGQAAPDDPQGLYRRTLARAYGFEVGEDDGHRYLLDRDDFFQAADDFRAWLLAAQIEEKLVQSFGERWWTKSEAGDFLKALWSEGNRFTVDELAQKLGATGLRIEPLVAHLQTQTQPAPVKGAPSVK